MLLAIRNHPLFVTLRELKGNPRITVWTEIMFGLPYNLFMPFFSVYMLALGVTDQEIGSIASLGLILQVFTAFVSGAIVDKFGRRLTLFVVDFLCWCVPCLIWFAAQDVRYFVAAAIMNSLWRIAHTAWNCLVVEDAETRHLVHIWTWIMIFAFATALLTPVGGWLVDTYGLVPAMRGVFMFGFIMLTAKNFLLYFFSHETERGIQRKAETKGRSIPGLLAEYGGVFKLILRSRAVLSALSLMVILNIYTTINNSFWGVLFTSKLGFADSQIATFAAVRSVVMTFAFFAIGPRLTNLRRFRLPMLAGFAAYLGSQVLLVTMPPQSIILLVITVILEGLAAALVAPMIESLLAVTMESKERARISAMVYVALIILISPFGWIAGQLSAIDRSFPFLLNLGLFALGMLIIWVIGRPGFMVFAGDEEQPVEVQPAQAA